MEARGNLNTSKITSYRKTEFLTSSSPLYGGGRIPKTYNSFIKGVIQTEELTQDRWGSKHMEKALDSSLHLSVTTNKSLNTYGYINLVGNPMKQVILMSVKIDMLAFKNTDFFCRRFSAIKVQI